MSIKIEVLRRYIRELIKQEIDEASVTGAIDGGEGPPKTPAAFRKKNSKKIKKAGHEEGHKDPAIFGFTKVSEAKFHVKTEIGSVIIDAGGKGEAVMKVAKALKKGRKGIISVNRVGVSKAKQVDKKLENVTEDINSKGYSQLNTMAKHATIYLRDLSKALRKQDDSAVLREVHFLAAQFTTMEKILKDKKWNAKFNESVNEARTINVEPNWEGVWRYFKYMAQTNPAVWKRMQRNLGSEWGKLEKMAQQKRWQSESVNEAVEPQGNMAKIAKVVKDKQATKLSGVMIDIQSASLLMKLYDKVSDKDKEKMNKLNAKMLTTVIKRLWSRVNLKLPV